jgi:hypothetical protein
MKDEQNKQSIKIEAEMQRDKEETETRLQSLRGDLNASSASLNQRLSQVCGLIHHVE